MHQESPSLRRPAVAAAPAADRGRPPDAGGADLLPPRQPVLAAPAGGLGRPRGAVVDPGRRRRRARLLVGALVRPARPPSSWRSARAWARRPRRSPRPARRTTCWRSRCGDPASPTALARVADAGATNVRFCSVDAVWSMQQLVSPASLAELWTFFPDPWHKTRHHKRRLVTPDFARLAASRLAPGGTLAAGHRLGGLRRADGRGARRRARLSTAAWSRAGTSGRSRGSSARASPPVARSPTWPTCAAEADLRRARLPPAGAARSWTRMCRGRRSTSPAGTRPRRSRTRGRPVPPRSIVRAAPGGRVAEQGGDALAPGEHRLHDRLRRAVLPRAGAR